MKIFFEEIKGNDYKMIKRFFNENFKEKFIKSGRSR